MAPGDRLPDVTLATLSGDRRPLTSRRTGRVLAVLHGDGCAACRRWRAQLDAARDAFRDWDAEAVAVLPASDPPAGPTEGPVLLRDGPLGDLAPDRVAVLVADRHGQVWRVDTADDADGLPAPADLERDTLWIAIQCPECGVPDQPDQERWETSA